MLYNLIIFVLTPAILLVSGFLCFKIGYNTGRAVEKAINLPSIVPSIRRDKPVSIPDEQARLNKILTNIDNYDGTGEGQIKI